MRISEILLENTFAQFRGILTMIDLPSDRSPSGARGHRVILTYDACREALSGLEGSILNGVETLDGHDLNHRVGTISNAKIVRTNNNFYQINVEGYISDLNLINILQKHKNYLGMSYDISNVRIKDINAQIWVATKFDFVGGAVLLREHAAYNSSHLELI